MRAHRTEWLAVILYDACWEGQHECRLLEEDQLIGIYRGARGAGIHPRPVPNYRALSM